eukprot:gb/GECG01001254.1/.p1 GENE.gb/GECG01001254.1/~~gb/GECG01001254.1/.p1  ORF type:complete len:996 (+),score=117.11 gb/GECG01001254.1/:1-2988(+)
MLSTIDTMVCSPLRVDGKSHDFRVPAPGGHQVTQQELKQSPRHPYMKLKAQPWRWALHVFALCILATSSRGGEDLRDEIMDGSADCFEYIEDQELFRLTCSVLRWTDEYSSDTYVTLKKNEEFDGMDREIDLTGVTGFHGLFEIDETGISSLNEAPLIQRTHVRKGQTATRGGFLIRANQKKFRIDSCSSTGKILGDKSGGICGSGVGKDGGYVKITNCHSEGTIEGKDSGGICGNIIGRNNGKATILHCYSVGDVTGRNSGGIVGSNGGFAADEIKISECYSRGNMDASGSGGIAAPDAGELNGKVSITNCYTTGDISSSKAGGILGFDIAEQDGNTFVENTYSSGKVKHSNAGGIVGGVASDAGTVEVKNSVYNSVRLVGGDEAVTKEEDNSGELDDIRGKLYRVNEDGGWSPDVWVAPWSNKLPILRFQLGNLPSPTPSKSGTPTRTVSPSATSTATSTLTPSYTPTSSKSGTPTKTVSSSATLTTTSTSTPSNTPTPTSSPSQTMTGSATSTVSVTPTSSGTATATSSPSSTQTATSTPTSSNTGTATISSTSSTSGTPTWSPSSSSSPSCTKTSTTSPSRTVSRTPTFSWTGTMTPSPSTTPFRTPSESVTSSPSSSNTHSTTPSCSASLVVEGDSGLASTSGDSIGSAVATGITLGGVIVAAVMLIAIILVYRRKRDTQTHHRIEDDLSNYAAQLNIPLDSFVIASRMDCPELRNDKTSRSNLRSEVPSMHVNPLVPRDSSQADAGVDAFATIQGNPMNKASAGVNTSETSASGAILVNLSAKLMRENVRIVSVELPVSAEGPPRVAVASRLDTSGLSPRNKAKLAMRQWTSVLVSSPPPLVQVETDIDKVQQDGSNPSLTSSQAQRLAFAKNSTSMGGTWVRDSAQKRMAEHSSKPDSISDEVQGLGFAQKRDRNVIYMRNALFEQARSRRMKTLTSSYGSSKTEFAQRLPMTSSSNAGSAVQSSNGLGHFSGVRLLNQSTPRSRSKR